MSSRHPFLVIGSIVVGAIGGIGLGVLNARRDRKYDEACLRAVLAKLAEFPKGLEFRISKAENHPLVDALKTIRTHRGSLSAMLDPGLRVMLALHELEKRGWAAQGTKKVPDRLKVVIIATGLRISEFPDNIWKLTELGRQQLKSA